jgi:aromatic-L-amino-acid decarboxylase
MDPARSPSFSARDRKAMTPEEFRAAGHRLIDWIADYRTRVEQRPVMARTEPGEIKAQLPSSPPDAPDPFDAIVADLDRVVVPGLSHWQHPRFFGYFPSNGSLASVLGDYVSTGLGVLGLAWQSSPALTEVEEVATDWLRQMLGLSNAWSGVIQDTASTSTLIALICARERATAFSLTRGGLQAEPRPLTVYTSAHSHSSVAKAALLAGFGRDNIRIVAHDNAYAMQPDALAAAIDADLQRGALPCAVVATAGSTTSTAFDPLAAIGNLAAKHAVWFHVDAAMAGSAMILPECRPLWDGIERADSLVVNPHKWLFTPVDCSVLYVRRPEVMKRAFQHIPEYLIVPDEPGIVNMMNYSITLGRRFRALKLWFVIRNFGVDGLRSMIREHIRIAKCLAGWIDEDPEFERLADANFSTVVFRHRPRGMKESELDAHNARILERVLAKREVFFSHTRVRGKYALRIAIGNIHTTEAHVRHAFELVKEAAV